MRILIQNSVFYPNVIGGAEHSSWMLGLRLSARGHHVDAMATTGFLRGPRDRWSDRELEGYAGRVYEQPAHGAVDVLVDGSPVPLVKRVAQHVLNVNSPRFRRACEDLLRELRPDVLHTNTIVGMTGAVWEAAAAVGVPVVHTLRDYHQLCPRTTLLRSSGEECVDAPLPCKIYRSLKARPTKAVRVVTAPSNFVLQRHLDHGQFAGARAEVVHNACPPAEQPRPGRADEKAPIRGVFLGQLDDHKGVGLLLDTLRERYEDRDRAPLAFDFAGVGPRAESIRSFCGQWPRVRSHGFVEEEAKDRLLREADFLVVPSIWNDNFPRVMLDAFRYGLPVIGSRRGGIPEVVEHESNGLIVEPTVDELGAAIDRLVTDGTLRERLGAQAHEDAARYLLEAQVDRFEALYREVVEA